MEPSELDANEMTSLSVGLSTLWTCLMMIDKRFSYWSFSAMLPDTLCFTCSGHKGTRARKAASVTGFSAKKS
jgi:hypothetical protein